MKDSLLHETGGICIYCGHRLGEDATVDHIIPRSRGGINEAFNKVACCQECNASKGNLPLALFVRKMTPHQRRGFENRVKELNHQGKIEDVKTELLLDRTPSLKTWGRTFNLFGKQLKVMITQRNVKP